MDQKQANFKWMATLCRELHTPPCRLIVKALWDGPVRHKEICQVTGLSREVVRKSLRKMHTYGMATSYKVKELDNVIDYDLRAIYWVLNKELYQQIYNVTTFIINKNRVR